MTMALSVAAACALGGGLSLAPTAASDGGACEVRAAFVFAWRSRLSAMSCRRFRMKAAKETANVLARARQQQQHLLKSRATGPATKVAAAVHARE